jgi:two-component system invasion response regulator UvrY
MIKVILCDDHAMIRRGIRDTLAEAVDIQVTAEAGSYAEVREAIRSNPCDVLLLDINLPGRGGLEVLASLHESDSPDQGVDGVDVPGRPVRHTMS